MPRHRIDERPRQRAEDQRRDDRLARQIGGDRGSQPAAETRAPVARHHDQLGAMIGEETCQAIARLDIADVHLAHVDPGHRRDVLGCRTRLQQPPALQRGAHVRKAVPLRVSARIVDMQQSEPAAIGQREIQRMLEGGLPLGGEIGRMRDGLDHGISRFWLAENG